MLRGAPEESAAFRRLLGRTFALPFALLVLLSVSFILQILHLKNLNRWVDHTDVAISQTNLLLKLFVDSETGMRGFLLNGDETFLQPYNASQPAVAPTLNRLTQLLAHSPEQLARVKDIQERWTDWRKLSLHRIAQLRQGNRPGLEEALTGKAMMDSIRGIAQSLLDSEETARVERVRQADMWSWLALTLSAGLALAMGTAIALGGRRQLITLAAKHEKALDAHRTQAEVLRRQEWINGGRGQLAEDVRGELDEETAADRLLASNARLTSASAGVLYSLLEDRRHLRRFASFGCVTAGENAPPRELQLGETWIGQVAREGRVATLANVAESHVRISSGTGTSTPKHLVIAPLRTAGGVVGVVELAFNQPPGSEVSEYLESVSELAGAALASARYRTHLKQLLEETSRQAELLQTQQEELRVNNEELQQQRDALQQSQIQLESQQEELEASNAQLAEQTRQLEEQRDVLEHTKQGLIEKADQLARANQYKSEFLANMSHELRTPLNSTLILAKLLADNHDGNLTPKQVKYAQTIHGAGNDLLSLINDILDLSRIEAGRMTLTPEAVTLASAVDALTRTFEPLAQQKQLRFLSRIEDGVPATIETDAQRMQQVLRNLLSNAFKFTERGEVSLTVSPQGRDAVSFAVTDTGVGVPADKLELIFEAFRQADGSTHRQFGGTGLGLTISRDLARRLGGDVRVDSTPGRGSTFTLILPTRLPSPSAAAQEQPPAAQNVPRPAATPRPAAGAREARAHGAAPARANMDDDRAHLHAGARTILIVEDDLRFADILKELAHEQQFQCLATATASEGFELARRHRPDAIILDVNLPDDSGLSLLERLKHTGETRHIPVHVMSVVDHERRALELGAAGYALKPVRREQLVQALKTLQNNLEQRASRVLVVEDTQPQRDNLRQLLQGQGIELVAAGTAAEALDRLRNETFDCMVLDLDLPDVSGYELLDRISGDPTFSFPPVIVYTARDLGADDELRLRRYASAVVVKSARSAERLLDEVTLFLHRVDATLPATLQRVLPEARSRDQALAGRRVLLVEDDVRNIFALTSVLEQHGAQLDIARNGREALELLERVSGGQSETSQRPDLVLMDIMMPVMDGLTAMREIRKRSEWRKLPIIALTAKAMPEDRERCLEAGANDYIPKPLDVEKLLSLVRVWMPR